MILEVSVAAAGKLLSREASGSFASGCDVTVGVAVAGTCEN